MTYSAAGYPRPGQSLVPGGAPTGAPGKGGFFTGVGFLRQGFGMYRRHPGLMLLGLLPALIAFAVLIAAFIGYVLYIDRIVQFLTPYLDDSPDVLRVGLRWAMIIGIGILWVTLSILGFVTLTMIIGEPFYEAISKRVEDHRGGVPGEINVSFWRSLPRTVADSIRLGARALVVFVCLLLIQMIPVVGNAIAIVLGAFFGGWVLALQLTSVPFERRGLYYRHRKQALRQNRMMTLGFGSATFLSFLIPFMAVIIMPAAVVGATLLARRILGPEDRPVVAKPGA